MKKIVFLLLLVLGLNFSYMQAQSARSKKASEKMHNDSRKKEIQRMMQLKQDSIKHLEYALKALQDSLGEYKNQNIHLDSLNRKHIAADSTRSLFEVRTRRIIGSLFGESKQLNNADSIMRAFDARPSFGIHKDNYLVVGTEVFGRKTQNNSDAKFQVSIRQRLTNSTLPFKTYLFLTYTQRAYWDVFKDSFPFRDLNYNPTIGLGRALISDNRFLGTVCFEFEHESNGKDAEDSRSWNKISLGTQIIFSDKWALQAKAWVPIVDGEENKHITSYNGLGFMALTYKSSKDKYSASCVVTKRAGAFFDSNVLLNFAVRVFKDDNIFLFAEYYNGYGESLLDYNQFRQRIRAGIVLKPDELFSIY